MSALETTIKGEVQGIIDTPWDTRKGNTLPSAVSVKLAGGAVELDATFLYADLAHSSKIAKELDRRVAAKILKAFLATTSRLVKGHGGAVVSFDGDRILGVFIGGSKNTSAAKCGLKVAHVVAKVIRPKFKNKYPTVRDASFSITHGVGVDTGTVLAVRGGVRGDNDLIWIGRAPNLAAKLSDIRESPKCTFITAAVYNKLADEAKLSDKGVNMWEKRTWTFLDDTLNIYRSGFTWTP